MTPVQRGFVPTMRDAITAFNADRVPRLAAALSYYLVFSIAPLIIVLIALINYLIALHPGAVSEHAVRQQIVDKMTSSIGVDGARAINSFIDATSSQKRTGAIANIMGWILVVLGASGLFGALQDTLNTIFEAPAPTQGWVRVVRDRVTSLMMILVAALLIALSALAQAAVTSAAGWVHLLPTESAIVPAVIHAIGWVVSVVSLVVLFGVIYRILPDINMPWKSVMRGATITTILFLVGEFVINLYLAHVATASTYGAVGSLVILLLWLNYSMQTILFGAELTKVLDRQDRPQYTETPA
jgi:membrane protein